MSERQTVIKIVSPTSAKRKPAWDKAEKAIKAWTTKELNKHAGQYFEEYYQNREHEDESDGDSSGGEFDGESMMEKVEPTEADVRKALIADLRELKKLWRARSLLDNMSRFWVAGVPVLMAEVADSETNGEAFELFSRLEWPLHALYKTLGVAFDSI